jgi:ABC-2 type transport system ATP-binding protein
MADYKEEKYWSRYAKTFDEDQRYIMGEAWRKAIVNRLSKESNLGDLIEFGCGAGFYTKTVARNASHVIATDLSDEMIATARTQLKDFPNVIVEKADCEKTAFPDSRFDSIFMVNLIGVMEKPLMAMHESYRILKDGELLLIATGTSYDTRLFEKIIKAIRFLRKWGKPLGYFRSFSPDELRSLVEIAGFQVEEIQLIGDKTKALFLKARKR